MGMKERRKMPNYPFWLGGVAASMAACFTHPLDLAKVRMQSVGPTAPRPSMFKILRNSISDYGIRSVYTGLSASLMRQMTYSLVRLGSYEEMKRRMSDNGLQSPSAGKLLLAASVAGGLGGIAGNPADILLVRMTSDSVRPPEKRYNYRNAITGLISLVKEDGVKGLGRGLGTNATRAVLMNTSQVGSYDFFKSTLLQNPVPLVNYQFHDSFFLHVVASLAAGTCGTTVCSPADVIRTRIMGSSGKASPIEVLVRSLREEGPAFMFKGWTPAWMRLGPNTVLMFVFFEQLKRGWSSFATS
ncbi:mitochondrial carrier domain-containing protein [Suillus paluster]|uniref:mitochondrial carrier domain-containing protein n=1 Tax=Suillus paluster TaxID=48578 RepID=UPI001B870D45|nr:mitochondrial carrier domain-containing protein [Suillus paluster]KAG1749674.1 mitochondrial carrier domain-containing protein [Suillus paluster]